MTDGDHEAPKTGILSNSTYDILKFIAQIFLPALGTFYAAVGGLWGAPHVDEVVGTIVAFDFFLGALLGISNKRYQDSEAKYDGALVLDEVQNTHDVVLKKEAEPAVEAGKDLLLKVKRV